MSKRDNCVIVQSHKKINEAHMLWHQAYDNYFHPEKFRVNINAAIQAVRNITFALQNEKDKIPNFELWYKAWQEKMKADAVMKWLHDARTLIVHQKDLEMHSEATISILNYGTIFKAKTAFPMFLCGKLLIKYLFESDLLDGDAKEYDLYALIERRWVVDTFPDEELLNLVAYGIGFLQQMIDEVHKNVGIDSNSCSVVDSLHPIAISNNHKPVCMCVDIPVENIGLNDMVHRELSVQRVTMTNLEPKELLKKYKKIGLPNFNDFLSPIALAQSLSDFAKQMLVNDGYHITLLLLQTPDMQWEFVHTVFQDQTDKFMFWQDMVRRIKEHDIQALIFISETWYGNMDVYKETGLRASEQKDRKEALMVDVLTNKLETKQYLTFFHRNWLGKIKLDDTMVNDSFDWKKGYLRPIGSYWEEAKPNID